jgi:uncharacterized membrane protein YdjX (TVP38/TMEM64 family)
VYKETHFTAMTAGFICLYLFMQTFAIPGTIFLSVLAGSLFDIPYGLLIVTCVSSAGATCCYYLSARFHGFVVSTFSTKLNQFREMISGHEKDLFYYLLFLRMTPFIPNWFINVASPHLRIPVTTFFTATLFGLVPANLLHVISGYMIANNTENMIDWRHKLGIFLLGILLPIGCKRCTPKRFDAHN